MSNVNQPSIADVERIVLRGRTVTRQDVLDAIETFRSEGKAAFLESCIVKCSVLLAERRMEMLTIRITTR